MRPLAAGLSMIALVGTLGLTPARAHAPAAQDGGKFSVAGLDDEREVEQFFLAFKEAVRGGDRRRVASLVSYPITVSLASGRSARIRNAAAFVRRYDAIFDAKFKRFISEARVEDLWAKFSGVATPRGEIWFNGIVEDERRPDDYVIRITAINGIFTGDQ